MYKTQEINLGFSGTGIYKILIWLYPEEYRKQYGMEMCLLFKDMYNEEIEKHGKATPLFWLALAGDYFNSVFQEHVNVLNQHGLKKYLQNVLFINKFNLVAGILLLPSFTVFLIDLFSRIAQGDLTRYNRATYAFLSHTFLYSTPILRIWVILFPILAVIISAIHLLMNISKNRTKPINAVLVKKNIVSVILIFVALGFIAIIKFHDFAPCIVHGILKFGVGNFSNIIAFCKKA